MNFSICGGEIEHSEIPGGFPSFLALNGVHQAHAE
jgi:hypothetical protein